MEKMNEFFAARADGYEEHMLTYVEGSKEAYIKMAQLLPKSCKNLLDIMRFDLIQGITAA